MDHVSEDLFQGSHCIPLVCIKWWHRALKHGAAKHEAIRDPTKHMSMKPVLLMTDSVTLFVVTLGCPSATRSSVVVAF